MNTSLQYVIERHTHGWLIKAPEGCRGVPMTALSECTAIMPRNAVIHAGIAHALHGVFCIATKAKTAQWAQEITDALEQQMIPKELKWLRGVNTGLSSLTIFMALAELRFHGEARRWESGEFKGHLPADADDFSRCSRLVDYMGWRDRLHQVAESFPNWLRLVEHWDELESRLQRLDPELSARIKELTT